MPHISSADAVYNLTFILATFVALHHTFLNLKNFVRLYYKNFDNHDDHLISIGVSLVMSYMFIRMYIVLHDIDEKFDRDPLTATTNFISKSIERLLRIVLFFIVLFCLKPVKFVFIEKFWGEWYFYFQSLGEEFSYFMAGLIYDQTETMDLVARTGGDMWVGFETAYPPKFGVLLMLIAMLFMSWDAVSLVFRDFANPNARKNALRQKWPFGAEDRYSMPDTGLIGHSGHATYMAARYLSRIHGLRKFFQAPLASALTQAQDSRSADRTVRWWLWRIAAMLAQIIAYLTSLKLIERLCLLAFGLVLTASFKVQPHISLTLLALFGLASVSLSAYQYRIGGQLIDAMLKPFVFVCGPTIGPAVGLIVLLLFLGQALAPFPAVQWAFKIFVLMIFATILLIWIAIQFTKSASPLLIASLGIGLQRRDAKIQRRAADPDPADTGGSTLPAVPLDG